MTLCVACGQPMPNAQVVQILGVDGKPMPYFVDERGQKWYTFAAGPAMNVGSPFSPWVRVADGPGCYTSVPFRPAST